MKNLIENINKILFETMQNKGVSFQIFDLSLSGNNTVLIEPIKYKGNDLDGMQILFENGIFEVSETQAGKNQNEMYIYLETKSFKVALKNMLKGNKKRKPIKIWN